MPKILRLTAVLPVALVLVLSACSSQPDKEAASSPQESTPASSAPSATASPSAKPSAKTKNVYPEKVVQNFTEACVKSSGGKKASCDCAITQIQDQYTLNEFIKINNDLEAGKPMPEELNNIITSCRDKG